MKNKFNYRVCTNLEQSKQLINLGLTLETADMHLEYISDGIFLPGIGFNIHYCTEIGGCFGKIGNSIR